MVAQPAVPAPAVVGAELLRIARGVALGEVGRIEGGQGGLGHAASVAPFADAHERASLMSATNTCRPRRSMRHAQAAKLPQHLARPRRRDRRRSPSASATLVPLIHTPCRPTADGGEPRRAGRQVVRPPLGAARHRLGIEQHQVGGIALAQQAAVLDAEQLGRLAGQAMHGLRQVEHAEIAAPVAHQVQAEAGVAEEGEMRAGVAQRDVGVGIGQDPAHRLLVVVQELGHERGVEVLRQARSRG